MSEITIIDHVISGAKIVLSGLPAPFPALGKSLEEYGPRSARRSLQILEARLQERCQYLQDRLDAETVKPEEFFELFTACYSTVIQTTREEKISAAAALICNVALRDNDPDKLSYPDLEHFARVLDSLSTGALHVIASIYKLKGGQRKFRTGALGTEFQFDEVYNKLRDSISGVSEELFMGLLSDLNAANLIHFPGFSGARQARKPYANYIFWLTPLGVRFVEYVLEWPREENATAQS